MSIYYQHIGEKLWARDAPRSIGYGSGGVRRFTYNDVEPFLDHLPPHEVLQIRSKIEELAPTGFQIWGLPSGAAQVLNSMKTGDFLLLLESTDFRYAGQVIHRVSDECRDLSTHVWKEQGFPLIVFLQGEMIAYEWNAFKDEFALAAKYHMRGNTARLADERVASSPSGDEEGFIAKLLTTTGTNVPDLETDFRAFADNLKQHFAMVKRRERQMQFRIEVVARQGQRCAVCDIAHPEVLEAAHIVAKQDNGTDDCRNGLVLCTLHHRMFDTHMFGVEPISLTIVLRDGLTFENTYIRHSDLSHLVSTPPDEAIRWRWNRWLARNHECKSPTP